jgi:hypothetical protein
MSTTILRSQHVKLVSTFGGISVEQGGSCIYVETKEQNYLQELCKEKEFETSIGELLDYRIVLVFIYRSPDRDFYIFLKNLEIVIKKVHLKRKRVILCEG